MYIHPYVTFYRIRCVGNIFYGVLRDLGMGRCVLWITRALKSLIKVLKDGNALCLLASKIMNEDHVVS